MRCTLLLSILILYIVPTLAIVPADNLDNKSYNPENNTNTSFIHENSEVFVSENTIVSTTSISSTPIITVTSTSSSISSSTSSSSSSGGGGGGGSITSSENYSNILRYETHEGTLIAGQPIPYNFNLFVYQILITGKENEYDVSVKVELLKDKPQKATVKPDGKVIQYFNVITSTKKLKEAIIRFKTNQSAELLRWNDTEWEKLNYQKVYEDGGLKIPQECIDENQICSTYSLGKLSSFAIIKANEQTPLTNLNDNKEVSIPTVLINDSKDTPSATKQTTGFGAGMVVIVILITILIKRDR